MSEVGSGSLHSTISVSLITLSSSRPNSAGRRCSAFAIIPGMAFCHKKVLPHEHATVLR